MQEEQKQKTLLLRGLTDLRPEVKSTNLRNSEAPVLDATDGERPVWGRLTAAPMGSARQKHEKKILHLPPVHNIENIISGCSVTGRRCAAYPTGAQ